MNVFFDFHNANLDVARVYTMYDALSFSLFATMASARFSYFRARKTNEIFIGLHCGVVLFRI